MTKPHLLTLGGIFIKIGLSAYGGWSGAFLMCRRELIEKRNWISEEELARSLTYSQLLPGSTAVGIISGAGYRIAGWPGLIVATLGYLLIPVTLMLLLTILYFRFHTLPEFRAPLQGMYAALTGLLLANIYQLARNYNQSATLWSISLLALVGYLLFDLSHPFLVLGAGIVMLFLPRIIDSQ